MMRVLLSLLVSGLMSLGVNAGEATFTGHSTVSRPAEFITVELTVQSECYASPAETMDANNAVTAAVQQFLKKYINTNNGVDSVTSQGGHTSNYSRNIYVDGISKTVCHNTFQQTTQVKFTTTDIQGFAVKFAAIQKEVLNHFSANYGSDETNSSTFVNIKTPFADVCANTRKQMRYEALKQATQDAKIQFSTCAEECGVDLEKTTISLMSQEASLRQELSYNKMQMVRGEVPVVETSFEDITEYGQVTLKFTYPDPPYGCRSME
jgi:uncharacterized protein YggE